MSTANDKLPFKFQTLKGKKITFDAAEQAIISGLAPLEGGEWEDDIKVDGIDNKIVKIGSAISKVERDKLVKDIKAKLLAIQGHYCIYCGFHEDHCGRLQREHIAPKGRKLYPNFVFEALNLCLACNKCNCELKKELDVGSGEKTDYEKNVFTIVHPYLDDIHEHIDFPVINGRATIRTKNKSSKGSETIRVFELDTIASTNRRSGLLLIEENDPGNKYDDLLNKIMSRKYLPK